jgi:hypothetical protein
VSDEAALIAARALFHLGDHPPFGLDPVRHRRSGALEHRHVALRFGEERGRLEYLRKNRLERPVAHVDPGEVGHDALRHEPLHLRFDQAVGRRNDETDTRAGDNRFVGHGFTRGWRGAGLRGVEA